MDFDFSNEQKMLRETAQRYLGEVATFARLRRHLQSGAALDIEIWKQLGEMGWLGAAIAEEHGGLGLGPLELCVLSEELGKTLAPIPFFSTVCVCAELLKVCEVEAAQVLLSRIAAGEAVVTVDALAAANRLCRTSSLLAG